MKLLQERRFAKKLTTIKELLTSLNAPQEIIDACSDESIYYANEVDSLKNDYEDRLSKNELSNLIDLQLLKNGAKNQIAVKALLDLENLKVEKGQVAGLSEQIRKIKEENAFLFDSKDLSTAGSHTSFSQSDYNGMSDEQYYSIKYGKEL